ncbi:MAG: hypothetical protein RL557_664 [archaeon]|jgi:predicted NUDIX family phosphoesterase
MAKEDQIIMVVPRKDLFGEISLEKSPQGFLRVDDYDFSDALNKKFEWMRRGSAKKPELNGAETNPDYKQPIAYAVIVDKKNKKIFAYKRASAEEKYSESRLAGNWAWGFGGHVEQIDEEVDDTGVAIIEKSMERELSEELLMPSDYVTTFLGYINDESNDIGSVHIGLLYTIEIESDISLNGEEGAIGGWKTIDELKDLCNKAHVKDSGVSVDSWSAMIMEVLEEVVGN